MIAAARESAVVFTAPPPGLSPLTDFDLTGVEGAIGLYALRADEVRLFLVDPAYFVPEYAPEFRAEHLEPLGLDSADGLELYVVATVAEGAPVVNLLAPILVNPLTRDATQVILDADSWPVEAQLLAPGA